MKKNLLVSMLAGGACLLILRSNATGPSHLNHYDCTGAESAGMGVYANPTGCSAGGTCHGGTGASTAMILVQVELDSAGVSVSHYKAGLAYTVKITGTNMTGTSLPFYGFQLAALTGAASTASNVDAGTWASTGLPAQTQLTPPSTMGTQLTVMEHSSSITVPSPGTIFTQSFAWTAPVSGTGPISFWGAGNFVNGDALASALDHWNSGSVTIAEWPVPTSVGKVQSHADYNLYPNPVAGMLHVTAGQGFGENDVVTVFDLSGNVVTTIAIAAKADACELDVHSLIPGLYQVQVATQAGTRVFPILKQ